jgi:hypothetical protein
MDKITENSPKRLIVIDAVDTLAQELFGDRYDYTITTTQFDPIEDIHELKKPKWTTILGDESSELYDQKGTLANDVLINVLIMANVLSNHLAHAIPYLEDIEVVKKELIGKAVEHKGHVISGDVHSEDHPAWSSTHDIDYSAGGSVLRILFAIVLRIFDEND